MATLGPPEGWEALKGLQHDMEIDALKAWRSELKGAMLLVKFALGSSIASGLLAATALADLLLRGHA